MKSLLASSRTCRMLVTAVAAIALFASAGCEKSEQKAAPPPEQLTILTPHNEIIRRAFETAFVDWNRAQGGGYVRIEWIVRGTPQCAAFVQDIFTLPNESRPHERPDVLFGGGVAEHQALADGGYCVPLKLDDLCAGLPSEVEGLPTRDAKGRWYATGLNTFGIVYNKEACAEWGVAPPTTWRDLADARFRGWVALADPAMSGSNRRSFWLILQSEGWDEGWATIMRILANNRAMMERSSAALNLIARGDCLAGFAVNFDGLELSANTQGRIGYVNPPGATAIEPDVISVLLSTHDRALAERFVRFCLSEEGQKLWGVRAASRGGPPDTLYHYPINPEIYVKCASVMAIPDNPLATDSRLNAPRREEMEEAEPIVLPLVLAAAGKDHVLLQRIWEAAIRANMPADVIAELTAPPFDLATAVKSAKAYQERDAAGRQAMEADWAASFKARYESLMAKLSPIATERDGASARAGVEGRGS